MTAKLAQFTKILKCFFAIIVSFENFVVDPWPRGTP